VLTLLAIPVFAYLALLAGLFFTQRSLLYFPDRTRPDRATIGVEGLREVEIATEDGLRLLAWYKPPGRADGLVLVYFHGNGGNLAYRADHIRRFAGAGLGLLFPEYRGYGGNLGSPSEEGIFADGRAALTFLRGEAIPPERTVLYGESLGTGVAVRLASEQRVAAVLLESPYASMTAVAQGHYPYVPVRLLLKDRFDSLSRIAAIQAPLLVMQGLRDTVVPPESGQALFDAAAEPKELWTAPEGGHNDLILHGSAEAAIDFLRRRVGPR
jgi:fermentation-respiration switch protein FrsA (DUF1100 family)